MTRMVSFSMANHNLGARIPTRSGGQYTPEQWAEKKELITQLYARDGKSLREVKEVLRTRYDFRPTDRMYQRKIALWELEKKHKGSEMKAILRVIKESPSEEIVFRIRGRKIDIEEVFKYFRRRGEDPLQLDVHNVPLPAAVKVEKRRRTETNEQTQVLEPSAPLQPSQSLVPYPTPDTPYVYPVPFPGPPSPPGSQITNQSDSTASPPAFPAEVLRAGQTGPNYTSIPMVIDSTMMDSCSKQLLYLTQFFFDVVVPPPFFKQDSANNVIPWRRALSSWSQATSEGKELMQSGQVDDTLAKLRDKAHASVRKHIQNPSPIILLRYFEIIYALRNSGDPRDVLYLELTLNYVLKMAETVLDPRHPIRRLTLLLRRPEAKAMIGDLAQLGIQRSIQILFERCGPHHPRILYVLDSRTQTLLDEHKYPEASKLAWQYHQRAKIIQGAKSFEACQALRMLGDAYFGQGLLDQAHDAYTRAFLDRSHELAAQDRGVIVVKTQRGLAGVARLQTRYADAERHLQLAYQIAQDIFGEDDVQVKLVQKDLATLQKDLATLQELQDMSHQLHMSEAIPYRPANV